MSIRALLLDDDVDLLRFLQAELSDRGYDVTLAKSGDCALAKAKTDGPFDVALLDVRMPGPSGLDVCRALRAHSLSKSAEQKSF